MACSPAQSQGLHGLVSYAEACCGSQIGHLKTVIILAGGFLLFDEAMPPKKLAGVALAMGGIMWCGPRTCLDLLRTLFPHPIVPSLQGRVC